MIGWYVDIGTSPNLTVTHISDITIYDYNRPFGFGTNWPDYRYQGTSGTTGYIEWAADMFSKLGQEYSQMYAPYCGDNPGSAAILKTVFPSIMDGYPNLNTRENPSRQDNICIIFRKQKRVVTFQVYNRQLYTHVLNDDGSISGLGIHRYGADNTNRLTYTTNLTPQYYVIKNYTPGMSFSDIIMGQYGAVFFTNNTFTASYSSDISVNATPAWLKDIFITPETGGVITPDFDDDGVQEGPFDPVDPSEPGTNPPGTFDDESDPIPDSSLPSISAADTGFTRIYNPSLSQVQALARYLWTEPSVIDTIWNHIKQFFEDPMQAIIGFNLVPCRVQNGPTTTFKLMFIDTGVEMTTAANQFVDVDCGILQVDPYYGSALDYSPYTKTSLFLPYVGMVSLDTDEIMGNELAVKYRIDICSGSCVAKVFIDGNCMYQFSGHCAISIPINSADFSGYVQAAISVAKLGIAYAAGSAMTAAVALSPSPKQTTSNTSTISITKTERNPATGRQITTGTSTRTVTNEGATYKSSFDSLTPSNISNTVGNIMGSKAHVEHAGSFSGNTGYLGIRRPYLLIERPNMCRPASWASMNGYPAMITMKLGDCKGFTKVQQVYLCGTRATQAEDDEILSFLKSGVIL